MKLHPSIVLTQSNGYVDIDVNGENHRKHLTPESADIYASEVSGILWSIEVSQPKPKLRPQRIWDEEGYQ